MKLDLYNVLIDIIEETWIHMMSLPHRQWAVDFIWGTFYIHSQCRPRERCWLGNESLPITVGKTFA